ncbi:hypothetical protein HPB49_024766 [Dermacentor silvarum]|uniref:Uncharacterized protein n=1 Tax=Dermacentor silvarum TaxID=543639 RepID=A0ACB8DRL7_DERSI|nr:neprilysin-1 [Dermacentor silvarum]KAH7975177.1 hypothetical protein HPB49_024766 [Dermacentor silvarum]
MVDIRCSRGRAAALTTVVTLGLVTAVALHKLSKANQEDPAQSRAWNRTSPKQPRLLEIRGVTKGPAQQRTITGRAAAAAAAAAAAMAPNIRRDWYPQSPDGAGRHRRSHPSLVCSREVCERQDAYVHARLDQLQEPCENFYAFVCSRSWAVRNAKPDDAPYRSQTTAKLMYDLPKTLKQYFQLKQKTYYEFPGTFISQALFFIPNCTSIYSRNGLGWDPWQELLGKLGLRGWPFPNVSPEWNVSGIAGFIDGTLGIFPFTEVRVVNEYGNDYSVQLDVPRTILRRHQLRHTNENLFNYSQVVAKALSILNVMENVELLAENIVILEMRLEEAAEMKTFVPPLARKRSLESLPESQKWSWRDYVNVIFRYPLNRIDIVEALAPDYLTDVADIMDNTSYTTLANYMGYRTMVHLSPMLPDEAEFLVPLSRDKLVVGVGERFQACVHLLEDLFPFGMRMFTLMTLGGDNPLKYSTALDTQVEHMFNHTQNLMANLVQNAYWLNPVERVIAKEKILNVNFDFMGTAVRDLSVPALYYDPKAPPFDGLKLLQSFYAIQANTKRTYFDPWHRTMDLDNRHHVSSLHPDIEYIHGKNHLFMPYAVLAFLRGVSQSVEPLFVPIVAQFLLKGLFFAVDDRGASVDHRNRIVDWWSKPTAEKYSHIRDCFFKQYKEEMQLKLPDVDIVGDLADDIADNAVVPPLYDYYLSLLGMDTMTARRTRAPFGGFTLEQIFFVYYALSQCDHRSLAYAKRLLGFGETSPEIKVNIPLRNFAKFSEAFGCQPGNEMSPQDRCLVW